MSTTVRHRLDGVEINIDAVNRRLSDIEFFRDFSDEDKRQLLDTDKYLEVFEQGTTIIHEGEPEADLYVVIEGEADVFKRGSHKAIATLTMGSVFGEISFFSRKKRTTSIVAVDRVVVLKIPEDFFLELACPLQKKANFSNGWFID
jgi:CRP-like cAMP-binding protein